MPISVQQYRLGIIHDKKGLKYKCCDQKPNIDKLIILKKLKIPLILKITLVLIVLLSLTDDHHSKQQANIKTNKLVHFHDFQNTF